MPKLAKTITMDYEIMNWVMKEAQNRNINVSEMIEFFLKESMKKHSSPQLIKCVTCGATYSDRLPYCPVCDENKIKEHIEKDKDNIKKQNDNIIIKELNLKLEPLILQRERMQKLIMGGGFRPLTHEEKEKYQKEIDILDIDINKINLEIKQKADD